MELKKCGLADSDVAEILDIARVKVARIRKKSRIESTKSKITDEVEFMELYYKGFPDGLIAKTLKVSRPLVIKTREKFGLPPNFTTGERGSGKLRDDIPLYYEARRVLRNTENNSVIRAASRMFLQEIMDSDMSKEEKTEREITVWATTVIDPAPMVHPAPGEYTAPADKANLSTVRYAVDVEAKCDRSNLCGVPSPELLEKAMELRGMTESAYAIKDLVGKSGYVGQHETVKSVKDPDAIRSWNDIWNAYKEKSEEWAPLKIESKAKMRKFASSTRTASTGKKGKGGGCQNISNRRAYAGAAGY